MSWPLRLEVCRCERRMPCGYSVTAYRGAEKIEVAAFKPRGFEAGRQYIDGGISGADNDTSYSIKVRI